MLPVTLGFAASFAGQTGVLAPGGGMKQILPWLVGAVVFVLRMTCRIRTHDDPRPQLRAGGMTYVYAALHAHQVSAIVGSEHGTGAMVSRSSDGQILIPALKIAGCVPVRGSGGKPHKGGVTALQRLIRHVAEGRPAFLAVDGPRGPRGHVHGGVGLLAQKTGSAVVTVVAVPSRRWIFAKTWDRLQLPLPLSTIDLYFSKPLFPKPEESLETFARRIADRLSELERQHDPSEAPAAQLEPRRSARAA